MLFNTILVLVVQLQSKLYLDKNKSGAGILLLLSDYVLTQFTMGMIYFFSPLSLNPLTILSQKTSHFKEHNLQTLCRFSGSVLLALLSPPVLMFQCFICDRFPDKSLRSRKKLKIFQLFLSQLWCRGWNSERQHNYHFERCFDVCNCFLRVGMTG